MVQDLRSSSGSLEQCFGQMPLLVGFDSPLAEVLSLLAQKNGSRPYALVVDAGRVVDILTAVDLTLPPRGFLRSPKWTRKGAVKTPLDSPLRHNLKVLLTSDLSSSRLVIAARVLHRSRLFSWRSSVLTITKKQLKWLKGFSAPYLSTGLPSYPLVYLRKKTSLLPAELWPKKFPSVTPATQTFPWASIAMARASSEEGVPNWRSQGPRPHPKPKPTQAKPPRTALASACLLLIGPLFRATPRFIPSHTPVWSRAIKSSAGISLTS